MLSTKNVDKSKLLRVNKMIPQEAEYIPGGIGNWLVSCLRDLAHFARLVCQSK